LDVRAQLASAIPIVLAIVIEGSICVSPFVCSMANLDITRVTVTPTIETPYGFARAMNLHRAIAVWSACRHVIIIVIFAIAGTIAVIPKFKFSIGASLTGHCSHV
jgi:hypothetical protein